MPLRRAWRPGARAGVAFLAAPAAAGVAAFLAAALRGVAFLVAACFFAGAFAVRAAFLGAPGPGVSSGAVTQRIVGPPPGPLTSGADVPGQGVAW